MDEFQKNIITWEYGWDEVIKVQAMDVLINFLDNGLPPGTSMLFPNSTFVPCKKIVYTMCTQRAPNKYTTELYDKVGSTFQEYLTQTALPAIKDKQSSGPTLLKELQKRWSNHVIMNKWCEKLFSHLDLYHVKYKKLPPLKTMGTIKFREYAYEHVKSNTTSAILDLINEERDGGIIDTTLIKDSVAVYEMVGIESTEDHQWVQTSEKYKHDLEGPLLESTREYYIKKREEWSSYSTPNYCIKAEEVLEAEKKRVQTYLNLESEGPLLRVCEEELLEKNVTELLEKEGSGCRVLLENDKEEDLQRMFRLFSRLDIAKGLEPMAVVVRQFISDLGHEIIDQRKARLASGEKETNHDPVMIESLLDLNVKYLDVVKTYFSGQALFQKALKEAFVDFVNADVGKFQNAEILAKYCDGLMSGGDKLNENEIEQRLNNVVHLFSYLYDKDLFAEFYRMQLAKRLLNQKSVGTDTEKVMIMKLKVECGTQFTAKLEGMLTDLQVGVEQRNEFDAFMRKREKNLDISVQVLTTGFWPSYKSPELKVPDNMEKSMKIFKEWFDKKQNSKRLTWIYSLGNASITATFGKKTYDLNATTLQAIVLMELNDGKSMTYTELAEKLNIEPEILKPVLHSLSCLKLRPLLKSPKGDKKSKINETDTFTANPKFTSNKRKVRLQEPPVVASKNSRTIEEDRSHTIDAAIVRIMKARKTMLHQQLLGEVLTQLNFFKPKPKDIKNRIGSLIEREFLERDSEDSKLYKYLA